MAGQFFLSDTFTAILRVFAFLSLAGAVGGIGFIAWQAPRERRRATAGAEDRNWRFLFTCWSDSIAIAILYGSVNLVWLYDTLIGMLLSQDTFGGGAPKMLSSFYMVPVIELVCYALIMGIAVRLFLRIRNHLEGGSG